MMNKKRMAILAVMSVMLISLALIVWNSSAVNSSTQSPNQAQSAKSLKIFTKADLKQYNGQNGNPAYVAVNGMVYDVTNVRAWKGGKHKGYKAGVDLTAAIKASPHGLKVLDKLTVVGKYINE